MDDPVSSVGAYNEHVWSGGFNIASVDLIAMVVSDAGLASTEPQWWNASPLGCILIGAQPRGGWQVLQRAMQWGTDQGARCFGVDCKMPVLYAYFACSMRNRLEVWKSDRFISPVHDECAEAQALPDIIVSDSGKAEAITVEVLEKTNKELDTIATVTEKPLSQTCTSHSSLTLTQTKTSGTSVPMSNHRASSAGSSKIQPAISGWKTIDRGVRGIFSVSRPTKLLDGARGGQAFMCETFRPKVGDAYGVDEQARLQLSSILLAAAGLSVSDDEQEFKDLVAAEFSISPNIGAIFTRLLIALVAVNALVVGFSVSIMYALWIRNIYGYGAPYVIQLCSLFSWSSGAVGLLMMGGNPRVSIDATKKDDGSGNGRNVPKHIQGRLDQIQLTKQHHIEVKFGSLHGSVFVQDRGACVVPAALLFEIANWRIIPVRPWSWYMGMLWFSLFLMLGLVLQIAGARVATVKSEVMSIMLLIITAVLRGAGLAGPEEWMIPRWKRRKNAQYAVKLQGKLESRASKADV